MDKELERTQEEVDNVKNRSKPRKYMISMRKYMKQVETRQYVQGLLPNSDFFCPI